MYEELAKKLIEAIKAKLSPPKNMFEFALFLSKHLSPNELDWLESLGPKEGNRWLVAVLLDTGKYKSDEEGWVELR